MRKRIRYIAIHEAAHVVAACHLGNGIISAKLKPGYEGGSVWNVKMENNKRAQMIICYAGMFAEARMRHVPLADCPGSLIDAEMAQECARELEPDSEKGKRLISEVKQEVRIFIRDPKRWAEINTIADILMRDGQLQRSDLLSLGMPSSQVLGG